jgi:hypothetical protein
MTANAKEVRLTPACLRAIDAGRKSQMRSVVKRAPGEAPDQATVCPLGSPGDFLRAAEGVVLRITGVRMERLQEISEQDIGREGGMWHETPPAEPMERDREGFARWWDEVHASPEVKWAANPWVWVIEFERR